MVLHPHSFSRLAVLTPFGAFMDGRSQIGFWWLLKHLAWLHTRIYSSLPVVLIPEKMWGGVRAERFKGVNGYGLLEAKRVGCFCPVEQQQAINNFSVDTLPSIPQSLVIKKPPGFLFRKLTELS